MKTKLWLIPVAMPLLLLQACASQPAQPPTDRDMFLLFASYPVYVQQQICTTTRTGTAEAAAPPAVQAATAPVADAAGNPQLTASGQGQGNDGRRGSGQLTADQDRIRLAVQEQRYGCYASRRYSHTNPHGIYLAVYDSASVSALATQADFKAATNLSALRTAQRARAELDGRTSLGVGLGGGISIGVDDLLR